MRYELQQQLNKVMYKTQVHFDHALIKPDRIYLRVESTCFFRCKHCDIWKNKTDQRSLSFSQIKKVIDQLYEWLGPFFLSLSGGEPLLNPDIIKIIKYAKKVDPNIFIDINSNAFLLTEKKVKQLISSGLDSINLSLDADNAKDHNYSRGNKLAFQKVIQALDLFSKHKKHSSSAPLISLNTVIMKQNLDQLVNIAKLAQKYSSTITFQALWENIATKQHDENWFKENEFWPQDYKQVEKIINQLIRLKNKGLSIDNSIEKLTEYIYYYQNPSLFWKSSICYTGVTDFIIDEYGGVSTCFFFNAVENVLDIHPRKIWNNQAIKKQRKKVRKCKRGCRILLCIPEI